MVSPDEMEGVCLWQEQHSGDVLLWVNHEGSLVLILLLLGSFPT